MRRYQDNNSKSMTSGTSVKKTSLEKAYGTGPTTTGAGRKQSTIVAASKAKYAEKYGAKKATVPGSEAASSSTGTVTAKPPQNKPKQTPLTLAPKIQSSKVPTAPTTMKKGQTPSKPTAKSSSLVSRTGNVKTVAVKVPEKVVEKVVEEDYEDDFEEDYQSDFEKEEEEIETEEHNVDKADEAKPDETNQELKQKSGSENDDDDEEESEIASEIVETAVNMQTGFFRKSSAIRRDKESLPKDNENFLMKQKPTEETVKTVPYLEPNRNTEETSKLIEHHPKSVINFSGAKMVSEKESKLQRSNNLMKSIMLHKIKDITLFHLDSNAEQMLFSVSGTKRCNQQTQVELPKCNQSEQTDRISVTSKWTQRPPAWSAAKPPMDMKVLREEALGVGSDISSHSALNNDDDDEGYLSIDQAAWDREVGSSWGKVTKFVSRASRKMLYVLESQKRLKLPDGNAKVSDVPLSRGISVFKSLDMSFLYCAGDFLACANFYPLEKSRKKHEVKSMITVWSLKEPSCPKYFLRMWGKVTVIFIHVYGHVVVAGGKEGGLAIWDLDESSEYHKAYQDQAIRTATIDTSRLPQSHKDVVVGVEALSENDENSVILSMDKSGVVVLWSLHRSNKTISMPQNPQNTAYWSKLNLSYRTTVQLNELLLEKYLVVTSFLAWMDAEGIISFACGTVSGFVVRGIFHNGDYNTDMLEDYDDDFVNEADGKTKLTNGHTEEDGSGDSDDLTKHENTWIIREPPIIKDNIALQRYFEKHYTERIVSMDFSPHSELVLVGSIEGRCRIYSLSKRRIVLAIECETMPMRVKFSKRRSSVFYVGVYNGIQVYDLLINDLGPSKFIPCTNLRDFVIYSSVQNEFAVLLASNELKISMLFGDIQPLTEKESEQFQHYMALLLCS